MAEYLDDGEFWLPSEFLTDDDILMDNKNSYSRFNGALADGEAKFSFPSEFPYGFASPLSSPVESVAGSTETESDEEDIMAGLTRQMACVMLQDHDQSTGPAFVAENSKTWVLSGSPQSTLCGASGSRSVCSAGSSRGSPNGPSQVSSPPSTPMNGKDDAWDLLYAAAGQVVRMKMNDEMLKCHQGPGLLGPPRKHAPVTPHIKNPNAAIYSNPSLTHQQLQSNQFQQLKQQQVMKQQCSSVWGKQGMLAGNVQQHQQPSVNNRERTGGLGNGRCSRPLGVSGSAWPLLQPQQQHQHQQQVGSGMRAVFLGGSGSRRESSGTGVFLPRRVGNQPESRKKPACSTVLVPARVVQALNLNFDDMGAEQHFGGRLSYDHDALIMAGTNALLCQQKRSFRPQAAINHELRLPQEWTYCP